MPDGRAALISAATFAFAERGYEAADLRSIACAADVDPGLVRIHFGSKAGLWDACVDAIIAQREPMIAEIRRITTDKSATVAERLTALVRHYVSFTFAHPEVRQFVVRHAFESSERVILLTERLVRPSYEATLPLIEEGIDAGIIRVRHPTAFFALLNNAVNQPRAAPVLLHYLSPDIDPESVQELLTTSILEAFLHLPTFLPKKA
ncbi:TetR/AcrR family transcriptional regulator [Serratia sp. PAMC26656]|uniref:TetR/AcrR family transcriptional regulator n=1 Tax=Serratia sp. PAMC26656 TaxID=2775909 RepID=UPI0018F6B7DD|nr:TetR/AcrR family transcriptional regulator [Serratia sp. PAMC26656]MBJ7891774.1 TetR/AcrR family transcriptional regulator [Serratia sp. PAMC26656]